MRFRDIVQSVIVLNLKKNQWAELHKKKNNNNLNKLQTALASYYNYIKEKRIDFSAPVTRYVKNLNTS